LNLFKSISLIGTADIIGTGIAAIFWFFLASQIDVIQYGEIHYLLSIAGIAYLISLIGTSESITVYSAKNIKLQPTLFLISILGGTISSIIILLIFYRFDVMFILLAYMMNDLSIAYLIGKKLYSNYSKYILVQKILTLGFGLGFYYLIGIDGIIYGLALSYIHFVIIIFKVFRESKINFSLLKSHSGFITNNYVMNVVGGLRGNLDKIIIAPLIGFAVLGNYALALQVYAVLMIFSKIVFKYTLPEDASGSPTRKIKIVAVITAVVITVLAFTILPTIIPIVFPKYVDVVEPMQIISLAVIPNTITLLIISKFFGMEKSKAVLISRLVQIAVLISGVVILGQMLGGNGVATAFLLSGISNTLCLCYMYKKSYW